MPGSSGIVALLTGHGTEAAVGIEHLAKTLALAKSPPMAEVLSRAADLDDEDLQQEYISLCSFDSVDVGIRIS